MHLSIDSDDGLFSAHYAFSFSAEDMKEHFDGIYSAYFLFTLCFMKVPTLEQICYMAYETTFPNFLKTGMENFVIKTNSFNEQYDNDVLALLNKICDVILLLKVDSMKYHKSIDKEKVISGYPFVKKCVLSLKQELKDKKVIITHSFTDYFS